MDIPSQLHDIEEQVKQLPFLPVVLTELMALDKHQEDYFEQMVALARKDPSLTTLILKIANSAASGAPQPISSLTMAMSRIGTESISNYIATVGVTRVFLPVHAEHRLLWTHAIETAIIAEHLALTMKELAVNPELAYISGLLHDIGRLVMFDVAPTALADTPSSSWSSPQELPQVERKKIGYDHSQVGLIACKHWQLPKILCNMVRAHHRYGIYRNQQVPLGFRNLLLIIQLSDFISICLTKYPEWLDLPEKEFAQKLAKNCIHDAWGEVELPFERLAEELCFLQQKAHNWAQSIGCA